MSGHGTELLGAYVLGVLDSDEHAGVRAHLDTCDRCRREVDDLREMEAALGEIPPEAFLDGPPPDGDPLLRKALSEVRDEGRRRHSRRRTAWIVAAAAVAALALAGGTLAGRLLTPSPPPAAAPAPARTAAATDPDSGAAMSVVVRPAAGWVRLSATVDGVAEGEQCRLYLVAKDGSRRQAGGWVVDSARTTVDGAALMAPADIASVQAETIAGRVLVSVAV